MIQRLRIVRGLIALAVLLFVSTGSGDVVVAETDAEQRIADFWKRVDALQPSDHVSAVDLGQWALNVIERNPRARLTVAAFRVSTASMQAGLDSAGLAPAAPTPTPAPTGNAEQRIADFWKRVDALQPSDHVSAADLGQWALNVIERNPRARLTVAAFRVSTAGMQAGLDSAGLAPVAPAPTATPTPTLGTNPSDNSAPTFVSLSVSPTTVTAGATVTVTARVTDVGSGVLNVTVCYQLPNGQSAFGGSCQSFARISGSALDGVWQTMVTVPSASASGTWTVNQIDAQDAAFNRTNLRPPASPTAGGSFTVAGT